MSCFVLCMHLVDQSDLSLILSGEELTATIIARYQGLLKGEYNGVGGLEDPAYGIEYDFSTQRGSFVQVLHVNGNHWIVASNLNAGAGTWEYKLFGRVTAMITV